MPKASAEGLLKCKKLVTAEREAAVTAVKPHVDRGTLDSDIGSHYHVNCADCLALHECTRDNVFNARVNMLISPSLADTQAHLATLVPRAPTAIVRTGAGAIAKAAKRVAEMAAASSRSREEAPVGGERQVTVLLDTGASGRILSVPSLQVG